MIKQPPGSRPGINNFAIAPTTKPITSVPRIVAINSIGLCKIDSTATGRNPFPDYSWITCALRMSSLLPISLSSSSPGAVSRFKTVSAVPPA